MSTVYQPRPSPRHRSFLSRALRRLGSSILFSLQVSRACFPPRHWDRIVPYAYDLSVGSILLVSVVTAFIGAMLAVQGMVSLNQIGAPELLGMFIGLGGVREVFPIMAAGTVGARAGSAIAAELATLKLGQQLDALQVMSVDPIALLVAPRLIAALIAIPLLMVIGTITGLTGAYLTAVLQLHVDAGSYLERLYAPLGSGDIFAVLIKGLAFGAMIVLVTAHEGLRASGGPAGVGIAANKAVVRAMIAGSMINLMLSQLLFGGMGW